MPTPAFTSKDMGTIVTPAGTLSVTIYYYDGIITDPSYIPSAADSFINIGEIIDTFDIDAETMAIPEMEITLREDYSHYTDGIWNYLFSRDHTEQLTQFRFYLDEGAGDTFLFWGTVNTQQIQFEEHFYKSGVPYRTATVQLISRLQDFRDFAGEYTDVFNLELEDNKLVELQDKDNVIYSAGVYFYKISDVFEAMVYKAFGGTFGSRVIFPSATDHDMQYRDYSSPTAWYNIDELYGFYLDTQSAPPVISTLFPDLLTHAANPDMLAVLSYLCRRFGYVPRLNCDVLTDALGIDMLSRGMSGDLTVFRGEKFGSSYSMASDQKESPAPLTPVDYVCGGVTARDRSIYQRLPGMNIDEARKVYSFRYWSRLSGAYVAPDVADSMNIGGIWYYYIGTFSRNSRTYERTYYGIQASVDSGTTYSHVNARAGMRTAISDGVTTRNFYANEVRKNIMTNEMTIQWIEE